MAKHYNVHRILNGDTLIKDISLILDGYEKQAVGNLLWSSNNYFPDVAFSMAYSETAIFCKYYVSEKYTAARHTEINDLVYKDSCVELFIAFNGNKNYYNLEFNCIGTPYAGYGPGNAGRVELPVDVVKEISILNIIREQDAAGLTYWEVTLKIPFHVFIYDKISPLNATSCKANFYKCGDELPEPHYLSWNNILSSKPNFHLPEFFGDLHFV